MYAETILPLGAALPASTTLINARVQAYDRLAGSVNPQLKAVGVAVRNTQRHVQGRAVDRTSTNAQFIIRLD